MRTALRAIAIVLISAGAGFGILAAMDLLSLLGKGPEILTGFLSAGIVGLVLSRNGPLRISPNRSTSHDPTPPHR
jgi:hypothetical protein